MNFSNAIQEICRTEGWTLKKFSQLTNINYQTIRNYSAGNREPSLQNLKRITTTPELAKYQHILLGTDAQETNQDESIPEIDRLFQQMKNEGRENEAISILRYVLKQPATDE
jgi:transcriptional regulator with XRE-family HTH domain